MLNPSIIWLLVGALLCSLEIIFPTAFMEFMLGISAMIVALVIYFAPFLSPTLQVMLWLVLSTIAIFISSQLFTPKPRKHRYSDDDEAVTITTFAPGKVGRVRYEGNSWRACCVDDSITIKANERVYVVRKEGTMLFIMPNHVI